MEEVSLRTLTAEELGNISIETNENGFTVWATEKGGMKHWLIDGSLILDEENPYRMTISLSPPIHKERKYCSVYDDATKRVKIMARDYQVPPKETIVFEPPKEWQLKRKLVKMFRDMQSFENFTNSDGIEVLQVDVKVVEQSQYYQEGFAAVVFYRELQ